MRQKNALRPSCEVHSYPAPQRLQQQILRRRTAAHLVDAQLLELKVRDQCRPGSGRFTRWPAAGTRRHRDRAPGAQLADVQLLELGARDRCRPGRPTSPGAAAGSRRGRSRPRVKCALGRRPAGRARGARSAPTSPGRPTWWPVAGSRRRRGRAPDAPQALYSPPRPFMALRCPFGLPWQLAPLLRRSLPASGSRLPPFF